jgi:4-hydroxybenzoate polyprenyltransferase
MRSVRALRLLHPFPSFVNAGLVLGLGLLAGGTVARALLLAGSMLGLQFCIGIVNDIADAALDARTKPWKPIPAGLVSHRSAAVLAVATGGLAMAGAAAAGIVPLALAMAMLGAGLAYDLVLKPTAWAWLCYAVAFPLLPVFAWYGAAGTLPPRWELLLPLAALAAPALQLSNGLTDLEGDRRAGIETLASRLGQRRALAVIAIVLVALHATAWVTLAAAAVPVLLITAAASAMACAGLALSATRRPATRQLGWTAQVLSLAALGLGWLAAAT